MRVGFLPPFKWPRPSQRSSRTWRVLQDPSTGWVRHVPSTSFGINPRSCQASSNPIGEHPFRASDPSPTQRLSRETVGKVRTEPNNLSSGDDRGETLPGPTAQPNAKSAAGGSDYPATSASKLLTVVANWDGKSRDISQVLAAAFKADHYLSCVKNLQAWNVEPSLYINNLDKVSSHPISAHPAWSITIWRQIIDTLPTNSELQKQCIRALRKTCGLYGILPACYEITFALSKHSLRRPFASGGCADVWKYWDEKGQVFGVKSLRTYEHDPVEEINQVGDFIIYSWTGVDRRPFA